MRGKDRRGQKKNDPVFLFAMNIICLLPDEAVFAPAFAYRAGELKILAGSSAEERRSVKADVAGSIPALSAIFICNLDLRFAISGKENVFVQSQNRQSQIANRNGR